MLGPIWLQALLIAIQDAPAIVSAIQLASLPPLTDAQMTTLQDAMNAAVTKLDADIAAKFPAPPAKTT